MNTKEIKITVPEGYEIDKENSTFECIKFKKKGLTYADVAEKLFKNKRTYFIGTMSNITDYTPEGNGVYLPNQAPSKKQLQRLLAINRLMNVAEYLNGDWKPDWKNINYSKWFISWSYWQNQFEIDSQYLYQSVNIYFKTPDLALQAIEILGEEEVKLALGV
jgi:hypothetical protein